MSEPRRVKLLLEYDGTAYAGWQRQANALSVQEAVERALAALTGEAVTLTGASRTDAGVHALGQVAHFDTRSEIPDDKFSYALNTVLPPDIRARASSGVAPDFHARFHAAGKIYRYLIHSSPHAAAIDRHACAHMIYPLDEVAMAREAQAVIGTHDFRAFAASGSEAKSTVRTVHRIEVHRRGERYAVWVEGDGFLYNMVRILAGTLIGVGSGKLGSGAIERSIATGDRLALGITAPAHGLTLVGVCYNEGRVKECFDRAIATYGP